MANKQLRLGGNRRYITEWNISYTESDGEDGLREILIVLPNYLKVLWWFIRTWHKACEIYIWKSARCVEEEDFEWEDWNAEY